MSNRMFLAGLATLTVAAALCTTAVAAGEQPAASPAPAAAPAPTATTTTATNGHVTTRQAIRAMPLLERPNRFGHFYGNTVRRLHERSL